MYVIYQPQRPQVRSTEELRHWSQSEFDKISANFSGVLNNFLLLDGSNSPMTGALGTQALYPAINETYALGTTSAKYSALYVGTIESITGTPTSITRQGVGRYTIIAHSKKSATGTTNFWASQEGSICMGSAQAVGTNSTATLKSSGIGSFLSATASVSAGAWTSTAESTSNGTTVFGRAVSTLANSYLGATQSAAFVSGLAINGSIIANGLASVALGYATGATINSGNWGTFGGGAAFGFNITAGNPGDFAFGYAAGGAISAIGGGSVALGDSVLGQIVASGNNSMQFGPGVNPDQDSLKVGNGIRLLGGVYAAPPAWLRNGDIWLDNVGVVWIFSGGVNHACVNIPL